MKNFPARKSFALLACALALAGCAAPVRGLFPPKPGEKTEVFYIVDHGWHTGLIVKSSTLPQTALPQGLIPPRQWRRFPYMEFGWGDDGFYNAKKITLGITLKALFWKNPAVLHVVAMDKPPETYFPYSGLVRVTVGEKGYRQLCDFLAASYGKDAGGRQVALGPGIYGMSRFYRATGYYYFPNTCNVWTAHALRSTGVPILIARSILAADVFSQAGHCGMLVRKP